MKIYLAGPLFSVAERNFNNELTRLLRNKGHEVWLPQEFEQRTMTAKQIFAKDVEGIDWADVVVANMDGPDPDSGTSWECGYAYRKKPVILFRTDFRAGYKLGGDRLQLGGLHQNGRRRRALLGLGARPQDRRQQTRRDESRCPLTPLTHCLRPHS